MRVDLAAVAAVALVSTRAPVNPLSPWTTHDKVVPRPPDQAVISQIAEQEVGTFVSCQSIVEPAAVKVLDRDQLVDALPRRTGGFEIDGDASGTISERRGVRATSTVKAVSSAPTNEEVTVSQTTEKIVTSLTVYAIATTIAKDHVARVRANDGFNVSDDIPAVPARLAASERDTHARCEQERHGVAPGFTIQSVRSGSAEEQIGVRPARRSIGPASSEQTIGTRNAG